MIAHCYLQSLVSIFLFWSPHLWWGWVSHFLFALSTGPFWLSVVITNSLDSESEYWRGSFGVENCLYHYVPNRGGGDKGRGVIVISTGHFRVHLSLRFKARLSATSLLWKSVFIHVEIGTSYHNNNFALRLALKKRVNGTRKWPIVGPLVKWSGQFPTSLLIGETVEVTKDRREKVSSATKVVSNTRRNERRRKHEIQTPLYRR